MVLVSAGNVVFIFPSVRLVEVCRSRLATKLFRQIHAAAVPATSCRRDMQQNAVNRLDNLRTTKAGDNYALVPSVGLAGSNENDFRSIVGRFVA